MAFHWTTQVSTRHNRAVVALLAALFALLAGAPAWAAAIAGIDFAPDRIVLHFDSRVAGASSLMLNGPRIAVDVDGIAPGPQIAASGPVVAVHQRARGADAVRLLLDLAAPAIVTAGRFTDEGRSLTLMLREVDRDDFVRASAAAPLDFFPFDLGSRGDRIRYRVTQVVPPATQLPLPRVQGDETRPLVVIDAGHGGIDPGAIAPDTGLREKDVTLKIAKAIRDDLLKSGRVRVALTRSDDRYLVLRERFGIARRLHADLFISIHCDSVGAGDATGASVYTLSEVASDKEAARLAARENKADVISGVDLGAQNADVSSILIDLTQRETMNSSAGFARLLGREAEPLMPLKANFHRMASLMVLKAPDMPSILFETGYISNPRDAAFLDSDEGRERIAESVRRAVELHFARRMAAN